MIRIDAVWLSSVPLDMRAGTDTRSPKSSTSSAAPGRITLTSSPTGANQMKVLVQDGIGIWLAARRLHQGGFVWPKATLGETQPLEREQLDALVLGLPGQRLGDKAVISVV